MKQFPPLLLLAFVALMAASAWSLGTRPDAASAQTPGINLPTAVCGGGSASVTFSWTPVAGATVQYVDISIFDNGFPPGSFIGSQVSGSGNSLVWNGILTNTPHVWRVNALTAAGWQTSATGAFVACGAPQPLAATPACQTRNLTTAHFRWAPMIPAPVYQFIDLGWDPAFSPGSFVGVGQAQTTGSVSWPNIPANITQYYRINSMTPDGVWHSSFTGSFVGNCVPSAPGIETVIGDRLIIPSAGIDTEVRSAVVSPFDGLMPDPNGYFHANMYDFSAFEGLGGYSNAGNIVMAAHVDCGTCNNGGVGTAVFWNVRTMQVGDRAQYISASGEVFNYIVFLSQDYSPSTDWAPLVASGAADMTLITCIGNFSAGEYNLRHVVALRKI
jgi:hypothetical protein